MSRRVQSPVDELTPREHDVARLMARGMTNPQIAEELGIRFGTAKTHVSQVIAKLGASDREDAARAWRQEHRLSRRLHRVLAGLIPTLGWKSAAIIGAAGFVAVALPAAAIFIASGSSDQDDDTVTGAASSFADHWERLPDPPIDYHVRVTTAWTGKEALFIGGDDYDCPPIGDCPYPGQMEGAVEGAAYNPATNTWRRIADAPLGIAGTVSTAVVGGDVYLLTGLRRGPATGIAALLSPRRCLGAAPPLPGGLHGVSPG